MKKHLKHLAKFLLSMELTNIEVSIIAVLLLWGYCHNLLSVEFQPDETFWIASSVRLDKLLAGDFDSPIWNTPFVNYEVRPIPSYIVAISQRLGGVRADTLPIYWDWALTKTENISRGAMPSDITLWWSRLPMAVISVFSLLTMTIFIAKTHSRMAAYVFSLISFNDYFLLHLRRAMSEAPLILFTVLVLFATYKLLIGIRESSNKQIIVWSLITGALSGLAGQSKLTGLMCAFIPILGTLVIFARPIANLQIPWLRTFLAVATLVTFTALLTFVASYPFFYENTIYRTVGTFYFRNTVVEGQMQTYPSQVILPGTRINILFQRIFEYPIASDSNAIANFLIHWINSLIIAFGTAWSISCVWKRRERWEKYIVLLSGTLTCAIPMLFVPFDWDRYYLFPIFFNCIFFAIGVGQLLCVSISGHNTDWVRN
jgi:hypothetical protein